MPVQKAPALFLGHGSPMNALESDGFNARLGEIGRAFPNPVAIVCVSAHWLTDGTRVTSNPHPRTIHDFSGFPDELYRIQYPAPGSPEIASLVRSTVRHAQIALDDQWGFDHGSWGVLRPMYPAADIPVLQLSLDRHLSPASRLEFGRDLLSLRRQGIMIVGSGNVVHNLRQIAWDKNAPAHPWAHEFNEWIKDHVIRRDYAGLVNELPAYLPARLAVPTPEHLDPLFYVLGASTPDDGLRVEWDELQNASISMLSFSFGLSNPGGDS